MNTFLRAGMAITATAVLFQVVPAFALPPPARQAEMKLGDQAYAEMVARQELLTSSPEGKLLAPVAAKLEATGGPLYGAPFHFYIDRSPVPNAFVIYGPRVYVDRGLVQLADSQEELAGVLCHEMSHALHSDGTRDDSMEVVYDNRTKSIMARLEAATRRHFAGHIEAASSAAEEFIWKRHSRAEESRADLAGADLCSQAGLNPLGLVWMFEKINKQVRSSGPSWFSDHPSTTARIAALKRHLRKNKALFGHWSPNESSATPLR
jgi:predicted Zn-dependent protease